MLKKSIAVVFAIALAMTATVASAQTFCNIAAYADAQGTQSTLDPVEGQTFSIYVIDLVARWIESHGGVEAMAQRNQAQADKVYAAIDGSGFYRGKVQPNSRSQMNVTFTTGDADLDTRFWKTAAEQGLSGLKDHRSVGGLRASLYNAQTDAAVDALVEFMRDFEAANG